MFVKFKQAAKGRAIGDIVELDDAAAKGLIDLDIVEQTEKPKSVEDAVATATKGLQEGISAAVADGFAKVLDNLGKNQQPFRKGFLEIPGNAEETEINVENLVRHGQLRNFSNDRKGIESAYRFGMYCIAVVNGDPRTPAHIKQSTQFAVERCKNLQIPLKTKKWTDDVAGKVSTDKNNTSSGFLVPDEFQNGLIDLREKFGVFRQNTRIVPMASDTRTDPRRRGGVTAYFPDESSAPSLSDKTWDRVRLTAHKLAVLTKYSNELNEDATINIGDDLAGEIAYAFANKEDQCGFNGDGTSTYGGIVGVVQTLKNVSTTPTSTITDVLGIWQSAATSWNAITLGDFNTVVSLLPEYADTQNAKWYCSRAFWGAVMQRVATAAGGNRVMDIENGARVKSFLGYPVVVSQVLPKVYAANGMPCLLGDLSLASRLGDRRETTIALSDQFAFDQDAIVIRGTERMGITVHDVGENKNQTPRDPVMGLTAGPIVGLMTT